MTRDIRRIAVVGAGLMGHGIAQEFAQKGFLVSLCSRSASSLENAIARISQNLDNRAERAGQIASSIETTTVLAEAVHQADLVVEAVYEDLRVKQELFRQLDLMCPEKTILASTTSTFAPSSLAEVTQHPERVLVAHYANPPHLVPLVEIVPGRKTSERTVDAITALLTRIGKRPVVIRKEVPGFVTNRLQMALLREALSLVQKGVVTPRDVDTIISSSIGRRWAVAGVFEIFDIAGWDLISEIASEVFPDLEGSTQLPDLLVEKVSQGDLGVKTGKGFYQWSEQSAGDLRQRIAHALVEVERWSTDR